MPETARDARRDFPSGSEFHRNNRGDKVHESHTDFVPLALQTTRRDIRGKDRHRETVAGAASQSDKAGLEH